MVPLGWIGRKAFILTWTLQYVNLFMTNTAYIILAGSSIKAAYELFSDDHVLKLPYCIIIAGVLCAMFAISIPNLSALGFWLGVSTFFTLVYIIVAMVLCIRDGTHSPPRDYNIPGHGAHRIFTTIGAVANLVFTMNTGMVPEIQATVRQPVVENMLKSLYFQFTLGVLPMYAITFVGYLAYGASTSDYLLNSVKGSAWLKTCANVSALIQTVITVHIFASPTYEYLDTRFGVIGSALAPRNLGFRIMLRGGYLTLTTLVSAALPFVGDFMSLTGAISTFPLTFVLGHHMYLRAKKTELNPAYKTWHWINIAFFSFLSLAAFISACRLINIDSTTYHIFADV